MNYWAIDDKNLVDKTVLIINTKRKPRIAEGDNVILFHRKYDKLSFVSQTKIMSVLAPEITKQRDNEKIQDKRMYNIEQPSIFEEPLQLSEYAYSLEKVYRFRRPYRHFLRPYVSLSPFDFDSIIKQRVYWARTAFGHFSNSLDDLQYAQFIIQNAEKHPTLALSSIDMRDAWPLLKSFISDNYLEAAELCLHIQENAHFLNDHLAFQDIAIGTDDSNKFDNLAKQTDLLNKFRENVKENDSQRHLFEEIDSFIEIESKSESMFYYKFRSQTWPYQPEKSYWRE